MISERFPEFKEIKKGKKILLKGQYRSYDKTIQEKLKLILTIFPSEIELKEDYDFPDYDINVITLQGFICKDVIFRQTSKEKKYITEIMLAVNRIYGKTDYIPCITWKENAVFASSFKVGKQILVKGRIQSRKYFKKISENEFEERTTYEVSISQIQEIQEIEEKEYAEKIS